jgi:glycosyltransferase involved in cell wall biosynthesis
MSKIHIISPGRNPSVAVRNCIESVRRQTLLPASHTVIDDISDDDTPEILKEIEKQNISYLKIVQNTDRKYRLKNIYDHSITKDPEDIICIVDSDDWLATKVALAKIKETYDSDIKLEYVYSNFRMSHDTAPGLSREIPSNDWDPYKDTWITSHMSTFKVKALTAIPIDNFLDWDGNWFRMGTDHACILPLLYMLRQRDGDYSAVKHIANILYVYHFHGNPGMPRVGPIADYHADLALKGSNYIRKRGFIKK